MALRAVLAGADLVPAIGAVAVRGDGEENQRGESRKQDIEWHDSAPFFGEITLVFTSSLADRGAAARCQRRGEGKPRRAERAQARQRQM